MSIAGWSTKRRAKSRGKHGGESSRLEDGVGLSPDIDPTEDDDAFDLNTLITPITARPFLGSSSINGDTPAPRIFLNLKGIDREGEDAEHTYSFDPFVLLRLANLVTSYSLTALQAGDEVMKASTPLGDDEPVLHMGQYL
jgi:hypothetical protein